MKNTRLLVTLVAMIGLASCTTTEYSTNKTGWSDYAATSIKDYTVLGFVRVTSTETTTVGFLSLTTKHKGSKITYDMLLAEAKKLNADDIINVRIDQKLTGTRGLLDFITGYNDIREFTGNALAIKYKDSVPNTRSDGSESSSGMLRDSSVLSGLLGND